MNLSGAGGRRPRSLKARALQLLAQRDQSRTELRRKLIAVARRERAAAAAAAQAQEGACGPAPAPRDAEAAARLEVAGDTDTGHGDADLRRSVADADAGSIEHEVDGVLEWLSAHAFLSDARFAESRVHAREARFGNLRIRHELAQHGVALSDDATRALAESEAERAAAVCARKFPTGHANAAERARAARFLAARGFSPDSIRQALRGAATQRSDSGELPPDP